MPNCRSQVPGGRLRKHTRLLRAGSPLSSCPGRPSVFAVCVSAPGVRVAETPMSGPNRAPEKPARIPPHPLSSASFLRHCLLLRAPSTRMTECRRENLFSIFLGLSDARNITGVDTPSDREGTIMFNPGASPSKLSGERSFSALPDIRFQAALPACSAELTVIRALWKQRREAIVRPPFLR